MSPAELLRRHFGVYSARFGNIYTSRQLLQTIQRACGTFVPGEDPWRRDDGRWVDPFRPEVEPDGFTSIEALQESRQGHLLAVRRMLESMDVLVFTLGLTETWRARVDGAVFPLAPGVVAGRFDAGRHEFVNLTVADVREDLEAVLEQIAQVNPSARMILTVSPVPVAASYPGDHVLSANTYSKSVLRAAAGEIARSHSRCSYFPSYEIITGMYNRGGYFEPDLRSITPAGVEHVMRVFLRQHAARSSTIGPDDDRLREARTLRDVVCEEARLGQL